MAEIDPTIALSYRPPNLATLPNLQIQSPLEGLTRVVSLRNLMQEGQLKGLQLQEANLALQQRQQELDELKGLGVYLRNSMGTSAPTVAPMPGPGVAPFGGAPAIPAPTPLTLSAPPAPPSDSTSMADFMNQAQPQGFLDLAGPQNAAPAPAAPPAIPSAALAPALASATAPLTPAPTTTVAPTQASTVGPGSTSTVAPTGAPLTLGAAPGSLFPNANYGEMLARFPFRGPAVVKMMQDADKAQGENQAKQYENVQKRAARFGDIAQSVLDASDPAAAYPTAIGQALDDKLITPETARQWLARGYDRATLEQFARSASDVKTQHEIAGTDLKNYNQALTNASQSVVGVYDQPAYDKWYADQPPAIQRLYGPTLTPQVKNAIVRGGLTAEQGVTFDRGLPKYQQELVQNAAVPLTVARGQGDDAYQAALNRLDPYTRSVFEGAKTPQEVTQRALNPEQIITTTETAQHNRREEDLKAQGYSAELANRIATREDRLRDDFRKDSQNFWQTRDAYDRIRTVGKGTPTAASDIALLFNYMKLIDPTSRVAEGKYVTAADAGSLPDWVVAQYNKLVNGEKLSDDMRQHYLTSTEDIYQGAVKNQSNLVQQYTDTAKREGLEPKNILVNIESTFPPGKTSAPAGWVRVKSPQGKEYWLDPSKLPDAQKRGYTRVP